MSDCGYRYMDEIWRDDERDEQGAHARRLVHERMNTWSIPITSKVETCTRNIKRTPRPSKTLHTLPCGGEAMIHEEHIHHSIALRLDMDTTTSMNIPSMSCRVIS